MVRADDIAGYTYQAQNYRPTALIDALIDEGRIGPDARGRDVEDVLTALASQNGVDRLDESSFDTAEFPKVIFESQITDDDSDWYDQ